MTPVQRHRRLITAVGAIVALACSPAAAQAARSVNAHPSPYPAAATRSLVLPRARVAAKKTAKKPRKPALKGNPARALLAFEAMRQRYQITGSPLYIGEPFSYLWPYSQALAATVTMANIPKLGVPLGGQLHERIVGLAAYLDTDNSGEPEGVYTSTLAAFDGTVAPPTGPGGLKYYDDNDWVALELVRLYKLEHKQPVLASAEAIMRFEMAGWQTSPGLACPGGLPFSNGAQNTERNTVTTAPAAELALQLYKLTGNAQYLEFAEQAYEWVRNCLLQPNEMYSDPISPTGVVEPMLWSYNQGSMIGAGTMLYQATHNGVYLYQARRTAAASLAYFTLERLNSETPFFPAVYFRNLMYLDSVTHDPPGPRLAQAYVNYAWAHLRLSGDLFVSGSPPSPQLLVQAAITQIYGLLSSPPSTYF